MVSNCRLRHVFVITAHLNPSSAHRRARDRTDAARRSLRIDNSAARKKRDGTFSPRRARIPERSGERSSEADREIWITPYWPSTRTLMMATSLSRPHDPDHDHARTPHRPLRPPAGPRLPLRVPSTPTRDCSLPPSLPLSLSLSLSLSERGRTCVRTSAASHRVHRRSRVN